MRRAISHVVRHALAAALGAVAAGGFDAALANDSAAAVGIGGLVFERNPRIAMESEDLYLSADQVRVRYRYRNTAPHAETVTIAFPLPEVPVGGADVDPSDPLIPDWRVLGMKTLVDGKPVNLSRVDIARVRGKDVTARLRALGWPVRFWEAANFDARLSRLSPAERKALVVEGLVTEDGEDIRPAWRVATSFVRSQTFPAGVPVVVEHSYVPQVGGSVGAMLDREWRKDAMAGPGGYSERYCVDHDFLAAYDRKRNRADGRPDPGVWPAEKWLSYILSTGANWRGPIGQFHLTVDKGSPTNLVSLCMKGIRKTGPTRFEVTRTNFEPNRDLDILIVEFIKQDVSP